MNMVSHDFVFDGNTPYDYSIGNLERKRFLYLRDLKNKSKREMHIKRMNRWINDPLFGGVCKNCGKSLHCDPNQPYKDKPEFHHTKRENKTDSIDHLVNNYISDDIIYKEIYVGQVILLCHECHAKTDTFGVNVSK